GGGPGLGRLGHVLGGLGLGGGEVTGDPQDHPGQDYPDQDRRRGDQARVTGVTAEVGGGRGQLVEGGGQVDERGDPGQDRSQEGREVEAAADRLQARLGATNPGDEHSDHGHHGPDRGDDQGEDQARLAHGGPAQDECGYQHHRVGLEQVGGHAGAVTDVV